MEGYALKCALVSALIAALRAGGKARIETQWLLGGAEEYGCPVAADHAQQETPVPHFGQLGAHGGTIPRQEHLQGLPEGAALGRGGMVFGERPGTDHERQRVPGGGQGAAEYEILTTAGSKLDRSSVSSAAYSNTPTPGVPAAMVQKSISNPCKSTAQKCGRAQARERTRTGYQHTRRRRGSYPCTGRCRMVFPRMIGEL